MRCSNLLFWVGCIAATTGCGGQDSSKYGDATADSGGAGNKTKPDTSRGGNTAPPNSSVGASPNGTATTCVTGTERCDCYGNATCNSGLTCASGLCVSLGGSSGATGSPNAGGATQIGGSPNAAVSNGGAAGGQTSTPNRASGGSGIGGVATTLSTIGITPLFATCSNGRLDPNEQCDDGNRATGDGCTRLCQIEFGSICPEIGKPCRPLAVCGDGKVGGNESCDDANTISGDGCSADCRSVEQGWTCAIPGRHCAPLCGDGKVAGIETCDDGNAWSGDGCSSNCILEPGWTCSGRTCTTSVCGNGKLESGEACDNGVENGLYFGDGLGCSATCSNEPNCRAGGMTKACSSVCGDGNRDVGEDCDDGNRRNDDGCSDSCKEEGGFVCSDKVLPDTQPCPSAPDKQCVVAPIIYRDFDGAQVASGHPDFFYLGANGVTCIPNASGTPAPVSTDNKCTNTDRTDPCKALVRDVLGADGKPQVNLDRPDGLKCACRFTDWDNTGILDNAKPESCWDDGGAQRKRIGYTNKLMVQMIRDAASFKQWFNDSEVPDRVKGALELANAGTNQYRFSSSISGAVAGAAGRTVYDDLHDICLASNRTGELKSGFFPLEDSGRSKLCNIWPYWISGLTTNCCAGAGCPVTNQWDPKAAYDNCPTAGTGGPVPSSAGTGGKVNGVRRNFHFTTELRYLYRYDASATDGTISFFGNDDFWLFINGKLALDFGATHERLDGFASINAATYGLEDGKTYEIAAFHANRSLRESNYQLTLPGSSKLRSSCTPRCGDGVVTSGEECDDGADRNSDDAYAGCTTACKRGPRCGDGVIHSNEDCDNGSFNGAPYGTDNGCSSTCTKTHYCGDGYIDAAFGEQCDGGPACSAPCLIMDLLP